MEGKSRPVCIGWREFVRGSEMSRYEEDENKRQDKGSHGALPVVQLQRQIGKRQQPAEERHRTIQIVMRNRVQPAGAFQQGKIVGYQPDDQQQRSQSSG